MERRRKEGGHQGQQRGEGEGWRVLAGGGKHRGEEGKRARQGAVRVDGKWGQRLGRGGR